MDTHLPAALLGAAAVRVSRGVSWAGIFAGPIAWGLSTQANYALTNLQCLWGVYPAPWISLVLATAAFFGAWLSFKAFQSHETEPKGASRKPRTEYALAMLGVGMGVLFGMVILLQATAVFVFTGCER